MPSVTGPVSWSLIGARRPATAPRKARSPTKGSPSIPAVVSGARGSSIGSSSSSDPSGSTRMPLMPHAAWAIIRSMPGPVRQRRRGGQARLPLEHEGRGRARVGVRQAPDRAGHPVLKVDDLHRRTRSHTNASPWLLHRENGQPRRAWANLSVPWPSLLDPGRPASPGALLPLLLGPALGDALGEHSLAVARTASGLAWVTWAGVLVAVVLPTTVSLTALRIATPAALGVANWAAITGDAGVAGAVAVGGAALALVAAFSPLTGDVFIDGSSYGDERRFALRVPTALVFGPVPLAGIGAVAAPIAGPLLLAAEQWLAGAVVLVVGVPVAVVSVRALHGLARRWVVFVPAGLVLHDPHALLEPVLFPRRIHRRLGPAGGRAPIRSAGTSPRRRSGWRWSSSWWSRRPSRPAAADRTVQVESVTRLTFTPTPTGRPPRRRVGPPAARPPLTLAGALRRGLWHRSPSCRCGGVEGWRRPSRAAAEPDGTRPHGCGAGGSRCWWWGRWWPWGWWWSPRTRCPNRSPSRSVRPRARGPSSPTPASGHGSTCTTGRVELGRAGAVGGRRRRGRHGRGGRRRRSTSRPPTPGRPRPG